jgi:hypothetical protein
LYANVFIIRRIKMKAKIVWLLCVIIFLAGCGSAPKEIVTQDTYYELSNRFDVFRFYISTDVVLKEIIPKEVNINNANTRVTVIERNRWVNIKKSTPGRVQGISSPEKLNIAFEELNDGGLGILKEGIKPPITFIQKSGDGRVSGRYYFEYTVDNWMVVDRNGKTATARGPGINYNGTIYLLEYKGSEEPYLLYEEDKKERNKSRTMKGLK